MDTQRKPSRTTEAIIWLLEDPERKQIEAAKKFAIARSTMSRAMALQKTRDRCECCGQLVRLARES